MNTTPITNLIESARDGDPQAAEQLWVSVYEEMRRLAQRALDQELGAKSVQATELVHEAYLRLAGN